MRRHFAVILFMLFLYQPLFLCFFIHIYMNITYYLNANDK